jgi:hypothetical protein
VQYTPPSTHTHTHIHTSKPTFFTPTQDSKFRSRWNAELTVRFALDIKQYNTSLYTYSGNQVFPISRQHTYEYTCTNVHTHTLSLSLSLSLSDLHIATVHSPRVNAQIGVRACVLSQECAQYTHTHTQVTFPHSPTQVNARQSDHPRRVTPRQLASTMAYRRASSREVSSLHDCASSSAHRQCSCCTCTRRRPVQTHHSSPPSWPTPYSVAGAGSTITPAHPTQ